MAVKFNPFSGQLQIDEKGSGGASYIDGEVATYNDLPLDGTAALDSAWLVRSASGVWPVSRKQAGIYIRTATAGSSRDADYTYAGTMPDVFSDAVFTLYDDASTTRTGQFNLGSITAGQNRVLTWPDGNGTIARTEDFAAPPAIGSTTRNSGAFTTLSANNGTLTASAPVLDLSQTWNNAAVTFTGLRLNITDTASAAASNLLEIQVGGVTRMMLKKSGTLHLSQFTNSGFYTPAPAWHGSTAGLLAATNLAIGSSLDTILERGGAGILEQRNLANAQTYRIYNTTDAGLTNFERGFMRWSSNVLEIGSEALGTGSSRNVAFFRGGARQFTLIGSGALQLESTGQLSWASRGAILMSADGVMWLSNNAGTDFGRLAFGGTTSAFPALKRSSTALQVRLADDSAFAPLVASEIGIGVTPERPLHIQGSAAFGRMDRQGSNGPAWLMIRMATGTTVSSSWLFGPATGVASVANDDFSIIDYGTSTSGTSGTQRLTIAKSDGQLTVNGNLNLSTKNLVTDTATGTRIGTGTTQLLGFWNAAPSAQPAAVADATDAASTQARLNDLLARLRTIGIIAT